MKSFKMLHAPNMANFYRLNFLSLNKFCDPFVVLLHVSAKVPKLEETHMEINSSIFQNQKVN